MGRSGRSSSRAELRRSVLDIMGLTAAIDWHAQQFQGRTGILCQSEYSLEEVPLYRVGQQRSATYSEALNNMALYSGKTEPEE